MSEQRQLQNQVRARRTARGWSQEELALRRGHFVRAGVSAIEMGRLVPAATAVLALAAAFACRVEDSVLAGCRRPQRRTVGLGARGRAVPLLAFQRRRVHVALSR